MDPNKRCSFSDLIKIFETLLTTEEKENYKRMKQNISKMESNQEISQEAKSSNNVQDDVSAKSTNDIEVVCSNPMDKVIELDYVEPVKATLLNQRT